MFSVAIDEVGDTGDSKTTFPSCENGEGAVVGVLGTSWGWGGAGKVGVLGVGRSSSFRSAEEEVVLVCAGNAAGLLGAGSGCEGSLAGRRLTTRCLFFFPRVRVLGVDAPPPTDAEDEDVVRLVLEEKLVVELTASPVSENVYVCGPIGVLGASTFLSQPAKLLPPPEAHARNTASEISGVRIDSVF